MIFINGTCVKTVYPNKPWPIWGGMQIIIKGYSTKKLAIGLFFCAFIWLKMNEAIQDEIDYDDDANDDS